MLTRIDLRGLTGPVSEHLPRPHAEEQPSLQQVRAIVSEVRARGDAALRDFTRQFDGVELQDLVVDPAEVQAAANRVPAELREALAVAVRNVEEYHRAQLPRDVRHSGDGLVVRELHRPVASAGCYVPGGRATYPSTVIMTAVPARVAGVTEVAMAVPPSDSGRVADVTLAAAAAAGVSRVHPVGGAQAVAALAYGTESVGAVDVIVGPGSTWVALAQREVAGVVGVPSSYAGPSEVVVMADRDADATFAAIDVILQAEHGPDGLAWLVTWDDATAAAVEAEVARLVAEAPRRQHIERTLTGNGYSVVCGSPEQALEVVNLVAPEHLELMVADPETMLQGVRHAGAVFCGPWTPASLGDYAAGPNHVLPTNGTARFAGALGVRDFMKSTHVVTAEPHGLAQLAPHVIALATAEGLPAHAESVRLRRDAICASERSQAETPDGDRVTPDPDPTGR